MKPILSGSITGKTVKNAPSPTAKSLAGEMKVNKVFGTPYTKGMDMKPKKKMSKEALTKRKKSMISNVAGKVMGGLHSK